MLQYKSTSLHVNNINILPFNFFEFKFCELSEQ